ncbi:hypothetical protein LTR10_012133 [Elasticomyces elasticus]|nr:hypothetical protein LTR10_012133 [Elasticomyces elasticus]KAK4969073.1 hypothetical protein LTR42_009352 [Elasticomyces elasticus]
MFAYTLPILALASAAFAAVTPMSLDQRDVARRSLSGQATYYGGNVHGGTCSFSTYSLPSGLKGTALSDSNWDNAYNCGGCVAVTHGGKTVTAMIVDQCPGCGSNHLDLFPDAFSALDSPSKGIIDITWDYVPCPVSGGLQIHMKTGVSQYWFSAQVVNGHRRTAKMEVSTNQGASWKTATRTTYNFFEISSGVGASSAWIRVTSHMGTSVVVKDVPMTSDVIKTAGSNYA